MRQANWLHYQKFWKEQCKNCLFAQQQQQHFNRTATSLNRQWPQGGRPPLPPVTLIIYLQSWAACKHKNTEEEKEKRAANCPSWTSKWQLSTLIYEWLLLLPLLMCSPPLYNNCWSCGSWWCLPKPLPKWPFRFSLFLCVWFFFFCCCCCCCY